MIQFQDWLVAEPLPSRGTANAVMTTVCEYLRFGVSHSWVAPQTAAMLSEPKFLRHLPPGFDPGERGQFRTVSARTFRYVVAEEGYEALTAAQTAQMLQIAPRARDRFLVTLLGVYWHEDR
jgi:hypothetical protein